ncbi:hypothetical protein [Paraburkholderia sp. BL25I1N1]|uniref:hypothetical protein n=1 Tax=Paraburkholderia sp. BL25I1N1 TaxID=1938804 RepID=UPI000D04E92C|nr:hypothetical protein [Paraburkholderia sp. BL25I1N1]PRY08012.1 hypothetical protein B0G73_103105 [Paraburkholderia sp. BL25I1N1]
MKILRKSKWKFNTSAGAGVGYGSFNAESGMFVLDDTSGHSCQYLYTGFGPTFSREITSLLRLPKLALPKIIIKKDDLGGSGSTAGFDSVGALFLTETFKGNDLGDPKSLEGGTVYLEGAAGYLFGGTGSLMMLGINRDLLLMGIVKPDFIGVAIRSAPALLVMAGDNGGLQSSAGFGFFIGGIKFKGLYSNDAP